MTVTPEEFGEFIKHMRYSVGWSQERLAAEMKAAGVACSAWQVWSYEQGRVPKLVIASGHFERVLRQIIKAEHRRRRRCTTTA